MSRDFTYTDTMEGWLYLAVLLEHLLAICLEGCWHFLDGSDIDGVDFMTSAS
ncbi:MAG: hypothetical protein IPK17_36005 [Chloroflexi bacterium]|uniref:hypothetical protein n=1 Tax=Candidatus Flexifilum breve TaxID=3140694 RepID=UPI00313609BE|nr:hypothetical protein [Chloroflexota bacterium]